MSRKNPHQPYWEMKTAELREATREFDCGNGGPAVKPSPEELAREKRARHKRPGRPVIGKGAKRVSVSIEGERLMHIDQQARRLGLSRSKFIANAVERELVSLSACGRSRAGVACVFRPRAAALLLGVYPYEYDSSSLLARGRNPLRTAARDFCHRLLWSP